MTPPPVLVCTAHDSTGELLKVATPELIRELTRVFPQMSVVCTDSTVPDFEHVLARGGIAVQRMKTSRLGLYNRAISIGASQSDFLFYADFDRLLHWQRSYPEELADCARAASQAPFTLFGRSTRAFDTHPECQRLTEGSVNDVARHLFHLDADVDLFAACWGMAKSVAQQLVITPLAADVSFYSVWPSLVWKSGARWAYRSTEGLEWETPDVHATEIQAHGREAWLQQFESSSQWRFRVAMATVWTRGLIAVADGSVT